MNRRDAAFLAHLDSIEDRYLSVIRAGFDEITAELHLIRQDIAGIKLDLATHHHDD
jgi:hypothetical protein